MKFLSLTLMLGLALVSCSPSEKKAAASAYDTSRIIVLGGAVGETVYELGAGSKVIAADLSCTWPQEIHALPKVGYHRQLSAEGVLSLKPTLILATDAAGPPAAIEQLKNSGVAIVVLSHTPNSQTVKTNIRRIAEVLGTVEKGEALIKKMESDLQTVSDENDASALQTPKVLFLMGAPSADRLNAAGQKTAAEEIIRLAGGHLVFEDFEGYKPVSPESIAAAKPDVILYPGSTRHGADFSNEWTKHPALAGTPAVQKGQVYSIDLALIAGFGPRLGQAASELHELLYKKIEVTN